MSVKSIKRAHNKIRIKDLKLNALLEVTNAINSNLEKEKLFGIYEFVLKEQLSIGKLSLYINEEGWNCALQYGLIDKSFSINVEEDLKEIVDISEVNSRTRGTFEEFDIVIPVFHKTKPLAYLLIGDLIEEAIQISPIIKHLPFIQTLTNIIAVAIENKNLANETLRQEGVRKELELASEMQSMLLPTVLPDNQKIELAAFYQSHQQVGGDYYDFIELNKNEFCFCIADVSGKGVSAALLMSNFQANLRVLVHHTESMAELIEGLNTKVLDNAKGEKFITLFIAKYNIKTRLLTYVNAGHNPPVLVGGNTMNALKTGCAGLGMVDDLPAVNEGVVTVAEDAVLFCYTDGLTETENAENDEYGMERLQHALQLYHHYKMEELNKIILNELNKFKGDCPYADDIALLSCKFF